MTSETILRNARIVLADDVIEGSIKLVDGQISPAGRHRSAKTWKATS
jgi:alpha-D-ribose 1-methylphosphonate 5-triphosphate diphosphatase PhnM